MGAMSESEVQELQFAALVGLDWADQKHAWCLQAADTTHRENGEVEHTPEAIEPGWGNSADDSPIARSRSQWNK